MTEGSAGSETHQDHWRPSAADWLTAIRIPLAAVFVLVPQWRLATLVAAGVSDVLDGIVARRFGASRLGAFLDPVADKLFAVAAFGVVAVSGQLAWYEIVAVLARDIAAVVAFTITVMSHRTRAISARAGGKIVTALQMATLLAFQLDSAALKPLAWITGAVSIFAVWDYYRVANRSASRLHR